MLSAQTGSVSSLKACPCLRTPDNPLSLGTISHSRPWGSAMVIPQTGGPGQPPDFWAFYSQLAQPQKLPQEDSGAAKSMHFLANKILTCTLFTVKRPL